MERVGVVVIGRNEGERLHRCLTSVTQQVSIVGCVVYVDSGSTDSSIQIAHSLKVDVLELDQTVPFTAARARQAGFLYLLNQESQLKYVQFIDGDCEVITGWLQYATQALETRPQVAVACGRRRERFPQQSIYNQLCDLEWDTPIGEAKACGGDALIRVEALQKVGGFNVQLIAGEEPELCLRLRQKGWVIIRLDAEMTLHDAQILYFSQWWRRTQRSGYAYAEGAWLHGQEPEKHWVKENISITFWGLVLPLTILGTLVLSHGLSLILFGVYLLLGAKIYFNCRTRNIDIQLAILYSVFCVLGKFPQAQGQIYLYWTKFARQRQSIIEYKKSK